MVSNLATQSNAARGMVVLCCADENLLELAPVVDGLGKLAMRVELVSGVDLDSTLVNSAAERLGVNNLWVLCQSEALDAFQVGRLETNLSESGVPSSSLMTLEVDSASPTQLISSISHAAPGHDRAAQAATNDTPSITGTSPAAGTGPSPTIGALLGSDLPPAMPDDDLDPTPRSMLPIYLGAGGVAVLGIIVAAVLLNRPPQDGDDVAAASATPAAEAADASEAAMAAADNAEAEAAAMAMGTDGSAADTDAAAATVDTDGATDTDGETAEGDELAEAEALALAEAEAEALAEEDAAEEELAPTTTPEEQALIDAAIRKREIRSLDILLVQPQRSRRKSYEKAKTWCAEKEIEGITNWRLPTIGEIRTISDARLVPRDYYWTHTAADTFGDQLLVWNGKRKRITPKKSRWSGGRALCVRTRDGAPAFSEDRREALPDEEK